MSNGNGELTTSEKVDVFTLGLMSSQQQANLVSLEREHTQSRRKAIGMLSPYPLVLIRENMLVDIAATLLMSGASVSVATIESVTGETYVTGLIAYIGDDFCVRVSVGPCDGDIVEV